MGMLNVTPDSFFDGGRFLDPEAAIAHARHMVAEAPTSSISAPNRPGPTACATPVSLGEEERRLEPVLAAVVALGVPVSIDTMKAQVAAAALQPARPSSTTCGACSAIPRWRAWSPRAACRSSSCTTARRPIRRSISWPISRRSLRARWRSPRAPASRATHRARSRHRLRQDAGAKPYGARPARQLRLRPAAPGRRVAQALHRQVSPAPPDRRLGGSLAAHLIAVADGAAIIRAHDVAETVQALRVAAAIRDAR